MFLVVTTTFASFSALGCRCSTRASIWPLSHLLSEEAQSFSSFRFLNRSSLHMCRKSDSSDCAVFMVRPKPMARDPIRIESDLLVGDPWGPNQAQSDPIMLSNQTQPSSIRSHQAQSNPTRPNQTQPSSIRPNQAQSDPNQIQSDPTRLNRTPSGQTHLHIYRCLYR